MQTGCAERSTKPGPRDNLINRPFFFRRTARSKSMTVISVIVGRAREGRFSENPAKWILQHLKKRDGVDARLLDLRDFPDAVLRSASDAGHAGSRALQGRGRAEMDRCDCTVRRFCHCH